MSKVNFDGNTRTITILPNIDVLDVQIDLYSEWKNWAILDINLKFLQAFRTFGGDQTISGQFAPRYFFLMNGWRIIVDDGRDLLVGTNLYTDELDSPFIVTNNSTVSLNNSDAAVVDIGISETLDYNEEVHINQTIGVSGTSYPVGTAALPVNNLVDAKIIAQNNNISNLHIFGEVSFNTNLNGFTVFGGNLQDICVLENINLENTTFRKCLLTGTYSGNIAADNCILNGSLTGMAGYFQYCGFLGDMIFTQGATTTLNDCHSQVPGMDSPSLILNENVQLSLRKYSGGMAVKNALLGTVCTLEFLVGNCRVFETCTAGTIVIRGLATLTDLSEGTEILIEGLITPNQKVFGGQIG